MSRNEKAIFIGFVAASLAGLIFAFSTTYITVGVNTSCYFWLLFGMAAGMLDTVKSFMKNKHSKGI